MLYNPGVIFDSVFTDKSTYTIHLIAFCNNIPSILFCENVFFAGQDETGRIVEKPGKNVRHISGYRILDNHSVNLISSIATGIIMPFIALNCWPSS